MPAHATLLIIRHLLTAGAAAFTPVLGADNSNERQIALPVIPARPVKLRCHWVWRNSATLPSPLEFEVRNRRPFYFYPTA